MNAEEQAAPERDYEGERVAIADSALLVAEMIRRSSYYAENPEFFGKVIDIVEDAWLGSGMYSQKVTLENGKTVSYRVTLPVGLGHLFKRQEYAETFGKLMPGWVLLRHPYQCIRLCNLAIEHHRALPELWEGELTPEQAEELRVGKK